MIFIGKKNKKVVGDDAICIHKELETSFDQKLEAIFLLQQKYVRWLPSDSGGKYMELEIQQGIFGRGVIHALITLCSSEYNGTVVKMIRTPLRKC